MTQAEIDRSVRCATGESLREIRRRGFSEADPLRVDYDPEPYSTPGIVDWDQLRFGSVALFPGRNESLADRLLAV